MCSHWELMRMQSETDDMFLVFEHDTWYSDDDIEYFKKLIEMDALYLNIGLFMGCYGFEQFEQVALLEVVHLPVVLAQEQVPLRLSGCWVLLLWF